MFLLPIVTFSQIRDVQDCNGKVVKDIDGNIYNVIQIASQCWLKENLKVTKYRDGSSIPEIINDNVWGNLASGGMCAYEHDAENVLIYGILYNWFAVTDERGICPLGWHVPSDDEYVTLLIYLGPQIKEEGKYLMDSTLLNDLDFFFKDGWDLFFDIAGGKMKVKGTTYWSAPNTDATNSSGFSVFPGGGRQSDGVFSNMHFEGNFWTSTEHTNENAWIKGFNFMYGDVLNDVRQKNYGYSVRCIKD